MKQKRKQPNTSKTMLPITITKFFEIVQLLRQSIRDLFTSKKLYKSSKGSRLVLKEPGRAQPMKTHEHNGIEEKIGFTPEEIREAFAKVTSTPCMCGSENSLLECCFKMMKEGKYSLPMANHSIEKLTIRSLKEYQKANPTCVFPGCQEQTSGSHSISQSSQLEKIAHISPNDKSNKVLFPKINARDGLYEVKEDSTGRKSTSVLQLFCNHHDKTLFKSIDEPMQTGTDITKWDARSLAPIFCCAYRSLHAMKRKLERDSYLISTGEYRKLRAIQFALENRKTQGFCELAANSENIRAGINSHISDQLTLNSEKIKAIEISISSIAGLMETGENRGSHEVIPNWKMMVFFVEGSPPFIASSVVETGEVPSGVPYAATLSTIQISKTTWAYVTLYPEDEHRHSRNAGKSGDEIEIELEFSSTEREQLEEHQALNIVKSAFSSTTNIAISKEWWDSLNQHEKTSVEILINMVEKDEHDRDVLTRGMGGVIIKNDMIFCPKFRVSCYGTVSVRNGEVAGARWFMRSP